MARLLVATALCSTVLAAGGCGGSNDSSGSTSSSSSTSATAPLTESSEPVALETLGVTVTSSTAGEPGLVVQSVPGAGDVRLQAGDVIVSFNGSPVGSAKELANELADPAIGDSFTLEVMRGSRRFTLTEVASPTAYLGAEIKDGKSGVDVVSVAPDGPAERAGVKAGDVITALDGTDTANSKQLLNAIATHSPGEQVTVTVVRGSAELGLDATLAAQP